MLLAGVLHHGAGQRAGDVRRPEAGQVHAGFEVAGAGLAGQLVGVRHAEDLAGLAGGKRLEADAVGQVRIQPAQLALLQPLRGEQQVHAEGAAEPAHRHEQVREVRVLGEQLGELVDHDDQRRQRVARLGVVRDVCEVAGGPQQLLAAVHLAGNRIEHALHQHRLVLEVGDHRGGVRQRLAAQKRRAAFEVHQHEVQLVGRVRRRQRHHQGPQ